MLVMPAASPLTPPAGRPGCQHDQLVRLCSWLYPPLLEARILGLDAAEAEVGSRSWKRPCCAGSRKQRPSTDSSSVRAAARHRDDEVPSKRVRPELQVHFSGLPLGLVQALLSPFLLFPCVSCSTPTHASSSDPLISQSLSPRPFSRPRSLAHSDRSALRLHFERLREYYGSILVLNLVEQHGGEAQLGALFKRTLSMYVNSVASPRPPSPPPPSPPVPLPHAASSPPPLPWSTTHALLPYVGSTSPEDHSGDLQRARVSSEEEVDHYGHQDVHCEDEGQAVKYYEFALHSKLEGVSWREEGKMEQGGDGTQ